MLMGLFLSAAETLRSEAAAAESYVWNRERRTWLRSGKVPRDPASFTSKAPVIPGPLWERVQITPELSPTRHTEPNNHGVLRWPSNVGAPADPWPLSHEVCVKAYAGQSMCGDFVPLSLHPHPHWEPIGVG